MERDTLLEDAGIFETCTAVLMQIVLASTCTTTQVYAEFTKAPEDFHLSRTIMPMHMAQYDDKQPILRSQVRRLIARFNRFKSVVLDFSAVQEIGQAFADEIFRSAPTIIPTLSCRYRT